MPDTPDDFAAQVYAAGANLLDQWPLLLDVIDGIVAQTMARGFTREQAITFVIHILTQQPTPTT